MKGKLFIDTSSNKQTVVRLDDKELVKDSSVWHSQVVLPMIKKLVGKDGLKKIKEIEVNTGPGSFTGLRVGVAIAQALGYALQIPINNLEIKYA